MAAAGVLTGPLTVETVGGVFSSARSLAGQDSIDLGQVSEIDSAGVSLLIYILTLASEESRKITLTNVPDQVKSMIRISGVEDILAH